MTAAAVDRDIVSLFPVLSLIPTSTYRLVAWCSGLDCSRFSRFRWAGIARFSLVVDRLFVPAATVDFAFSFVELPLTAPFQQFCWVQAHFTSGYFR